MVILPRQPCSTPIYTSSLRRRKQPCTSTSLAQSYTVVSSVTRGNSLLPFDPPSPNLTHRSTQFPRLTMNKGITTNPEQHEPQEILPAQARDSHPSAPRLDFGGTKRPCARVRIGDVPPHIAAALEQRGCRAGYKRSNEVERETGEVGETKDAGYEAGETGCELRSALDLRGICSAERVG